MDVAGGPGTGVTVPAPGHGVKAVALTTTGDYELSVVTDNAGNVTVTQSAGVPSQTAAASDAACVEAVFNLSGHTVADH